MTYRVVITEGAERRLLEYIEYLAIEKQAPLTAEQWWRKALAATDTLSTFPHRFPKPPEDGLRDYTIRALRVDRQLVLDRVNEADHVVEVFAFRGGAERPRDQYLPEA